MEEEKPRYEGIQHTNAELRARIFATKNLQTNAVAEVENLKAERNDLLRRKVIPECILKVMTRSQQAIGDITERACHHLRLHSAYAKEDSSIAGSDQKDHLDNARFRRAR
jgi:hypothetical protein